MVFVRAIRTKYRFHALQVLYSLDKYSRTTGKRLKMLATVLCSARGHRHNPPCVAVAIVLNQVQFDVRWKTLVRKVPLRWRDQ